MPRSPTGLAPIVAGRSAAFKTFILSARGAWCSACRAVVELPLYEAIQYVARPDQAKYSGLKHAADLAGGRTGIGPSLPMRRIRG